jgi:hypothetical protein
LHLDVARPAEFVEVSQELTCLVRTARSGSSSVATGVPHTAITASPMNFSTTPS